MPIQLPTLDDRTYADLIRELSGLIPLYAPDWTDHNPSDPGITFLELFAWLAEGLIYRIDRVPEESSVRMLELLGATFHPARPATVILKASLAEAGAAGALTLPSGTEIVARPTGQESTLPFETVDELRLTPGWPSGLVTARQVARTTTVEFLGRSNGRARQAFRLARPAIFVDPQGAHPCVPVVTVNGEAWAYRVDLLDSGPKDRHFAVDARRSTIRFGTGKDRSAGTAGNGVPRAPSEGGALPPKDAVIRASYCYTLGAGGNTPGETQYELTQPGVELSLAAIGPASGGSDPTSLEDARAEAYGVINNPWRAITDQDFEGLVLGQPEFGLARAKSLPDVDASRSQGRPPAGQSSVTAGLPANEAELERQPGHVSVMVYPQPTREPVAVMTFKTAPRTVTFSRDGQTLAAWASPTDDRPDATNEGAATRGELRDSGNAAGAETLDQVWLWQAGGRHAALPLPPGAHLSCLVLSPDGHWLALGSESQGQFQVLLWDAERFARIEAKAQDIGGLPKSGGPPNVDERVAAIVFRPDVRQAIIVSGTTAQRWNVPSWACVDELPHPAPVQEAMFSADGRQLATLAADNAIRLWGSAPGTLLATLRHEEPVRQMLLSTDGRRLVTLSGAKTVLAWGQPDMEGRGSRYWEPLPAPDVPFARVTRMAFRQRGQRLAVVGQTAGGGQAAAFYNMDTGEMEFTRPLSKGSIANELSNDVRWLLMVDQTDPLHPQLWSVDAGRRAGVLHHDHAVRGAIFSPDGHRVATVAASAPGDPIVRAWDTVSAALEMTLHPPSGADLAQAANLEAVLSPAGKYLVTWQPAGEGDIPSTLCVWKAGHLLRTSEYLVERRLVTTHHHVVGTQFVDLQVRAAIVPTPRTETGRVIAAIRESLQAFFAALQPDTPLKDATQTGQGKPEGWPYGRHVYLSEVYQVIEGVPGVDHVEALSLYTRAESEGAVPGADADLGPWRDSGPEVIVPPNQLVHYVRLPMQGESVGTTEGPPDVLVRRTG